VDGGEGAEAHRHAVKLDILARAPHHASSSLDRRMRLRPGTGSARDPGRTETGRKMRA
jgi:hypothetical protein